MESHKSSVSIIIVIIIVIALGISGTWFLYTERQSFMNEKGELESKLTEKNADIENLKNEKVGVDQELAVLKANPLAQEAELLRLKLENTERDIAIIKEKITPMETVGTKIKLYADVASALDQNLAPTPPHYINWNFKMVDDKIGALNDSEVAKQWEHAKSSPDQGGDIHTYFLIISKIYGLLP